MGVNKVMEEETFKLIDGLVESGPKIGVSLARRSLVDAKNIKRIETALVFTHPYGALGGDANNNVVVALYSRFYHLGFTVARFDFRGGGKSSGNRTWTGSGEVDDLRAVCKYLLDPESISKNSVPIRRIILCGYSYGSAISSSLADELPEVLGYVAIAYPFSVLWAITLLNHQFYMNKAKSTKPKLFVQGDMDNFTSKYSFEYQLSSFPPVTDSEFLSDCDHFFWSREKELANIIQTWVFKSFEF